MMPDLLSQLEEQGLITVLGDGDANPLEDLADQGVVELIDSDASLPSPGGQRTTPAAAPPEAGPPRSRAERLSVASFPKGFLESRRQELAEMEPGPRRDELARLLEESEKADLEAYRINREFDSQLAPIFSLEQQRQYVEQLPFGRERYEYQAALERAEEKVAAGEVDEETAARALRNAQSSAPGILGQIKRGITRGLTNTLLTVGSEVWDFVGGDELAQGGRDARSAIRQTAAREARNLEAYDKVYGVPLASEARQATQAVAESLGAAAVGGPRAGLATLVGYYSAQAAADSLAEADEAGRNGFAGKYLPAAAHALTEGTWTYFGGRVLGAGTGRLAGRGLRAATPSIAARGAGRVAEKFGLTKPLSRLVDAAGAAAAEVVEEVVTELTHYFIDRATPGEYQGHPLGKRLWEVAKVAGLAGGGARSVDIAIRDIADRVNRRERALQQTVNAVADAERVVREQPEEARQVAKTDKLSRHKAKELTGRQGKQLYREELLGELKRQEERSQQDASTIYQDAQQVQEEGPVGQVGQEEGGANLQQPAEARPEARHAEEAPVAVEAMHGPQSSPTGRFFTTLEGQPIGLGQLRIDTENVANVFPGAQVTPRDDGGWSVRLPSGVETDIRPAANIYLTESGQAVARRSYPQLSEQDWAKVQAAGIYEVVSRDGERVPVRSLIALSEFQGADENVLRHEAIHWAKKLGLFSDAEWNRFAKRYARGITDPMVIEEAIATKIETPSFWDRVHQFLSKFLRGIGLDMPRELRELVSSPDFWNRLPQARGSETPAAALFSDDPQVRRRLANIGITDQQRDLMERLDREATAAGEPGVKRDETTFAEAAQLLKEPSALRDKVLQAGQKGTLLNDAETIAAHSLWRMAAEVAHREPANTAAQDEAVSLRNAYRLGRTHAARAFRQGHDPLNGKTIDEATPAERLDLLWGALYDMPTSEYNKFVRAVDRGDTATQRRIERRHQKQMRRVEEYLNKFGMSQRELDKIAGDPKATRRALQQVEVGKASLIDKLHEYRTSLGLFSGFASHGANIGGNAINGVLDFTVYRATEAAINSALLRVGLGDPAGARLGELRYMYRAAGNSLGEAMRNAAQSYVQEAPLTIRRQGKFDVSRHAIGGKTGRVVRGLGYNALTAEDEFFNSYFAAMQHPAMLYRIAKAKGLTGDAIEQFISDGLANRRVTTESGEVVDSLPWRLAKLTAADLTYNFVPEGVTGQAMRAAQALRRLPGGRWFLPVVSFPVKGAATALEKAPVTGDINVLARGMMKAHENWQDGRRWNEGMSAGLSKRLAERMIAWGSAVAIAATLDDDDPWITGLTTVPQGRERTSIRIGGNEWDYGRLEWVATPLAMIVDGINVIRRGSPNEIASAPVDIAGEQIRTKTFLRGLSDVLDAFGLGSRFASHEEATVRLAEFGARFGESFVPNAYRQIGEASREYWTDRRIRGTTPQEKLQSARRRFVQFIETPGIKHELKYDIWGRPFPTGVAPFWSAPQTDFVWRMVSPVRVRPAKEPTIGDRIIANYNRTHPDKEVQFRAPSPYFTLNKKRYVMTDAEYAEFQQKSGVLANEMVNRWHDWARNNLKTDVVEKPNKEIIDHLRSILSKARRGYRNEIKARRLKQ